MSAILPVETISRTFRSPYCGPELRRLLESHELLRTRVTELESLVNSQAERIANQSELLSKRAEAKQPN